MKNSKRFFKAGVLATALTLFISSCGQNNSSTSIFDSDIPSTSEAPSEVSVSPSVEEPEPLNQFFEYDGVRIQLLNKNLLRVEEEGEWGFEDRETFYIKGRNNFKGTPYELKHEGNIDSIVTENYTIRVDTTVHDITGVSVYINDELSWKYNGLTTANCYLPSPSDELNLWYFSDSPRIVPSLEGYSTIEGGSINGLNDWDFDNNAPDFYIFVPEGNYRTFCKDYVELTGKAEIPQLKNLGYWDSRWYAYSAETALQQINDYLDRGYSIDILVIDTDWRVSASTGYQINTRLFPDMEQFLSDAHDLGVNIIFNDHPEPVRGTRNGLEDEEVQYRNENLTLLLSLGLDYWWYDRNWSVSLKSCDPDVSVFAFGMYAYQWITNDYLEQITDLNEYAKRGIIMGNVDGCLHGKWTYASDISAHKYTLQWTGDIGTDSSALEQEIYASIFGGAEVGIPYMSSDIGGHTSATSNEMYCRWIEYGALSTICRTHMTNKSTTGQDGRMPWLYGETAEEVFHKYLDMRYRLLPLFYELSYENFTTGLPVMRRTDINYPQYIEASRNDQYLLGDSILVAPLSNAGEKTVVPASWLKTSKGEEGLDALYYGNKNFSGTPVKSQIDRNIDFDWGTGGPVGMGSDGFSIVWSGKITPDRDCILKVFADDGIILKLDGQEVVNGSSVYDTLLKCNKVLKAGSEHTIEVKYFEDGGNAHAFLYSSGVDANGKELLTDERTVFIPDGTWVDIWTGEKHVGPATITTINDLTTSPIFVKEGSAIILTDVAENTSLTDWSKLALDYYPSLTDSVPSYLFEDDGETVAYKDGFYRTTKVENGYDDGYFFVNINKAEGLFEGPEKRDYRIRVHADSSWGNIVSLKINGTETPTTSIVKKYQKSADGKPFAFDEAALDNDVYEILLTNISVDSNTKVEVKFANMPTIQSTTVSYDDTSVNFSVLCSEIVKSEKMYEINLNDDNIIDYGAFGFYDKTPVRSNNGLNLVSDAEIQGIHSCTTGAAYGFTFEDGDIKDVASRARVMLSAQKDMIFSVKKTAETKYIVLNVSTNNAIAKLTVKDRSGKAKTIYFGKMESPTDEQIVIECPGNEESTLYFHLMVFSSKPNGTGCTSEVTLSTVYASKKVVEPVEFVPVSVTASVSEQTNIKNTTAITYNLSSHDTMDVLDWYSGANINGVNAHEKADSDIITSVSYANGRDFYDYYYAMSWSDGKNGDTNNGTPNGTCTEGYISISLEVNEDVSQIVLFAGAWRGTNSISLVDEGGNVIASAASFSASDSSVNQKIIFDINANGTANITIRCNLSGDWDGGNVSFAAVQVLG